MKEKGQKMQKKGIKKAKKKMKEKVHKIKEKKESLITGDENHRKIADMKKNIFLQGKSFKKLQKKIKEFFF